MAIIVQDSFTDVDGTLLENHTDIGGVWLAFANSLLINNNQLENAVGNPTGLYYNNIADQADVYAQAKVVALSNRWIYLIGRFTDANNYYYAECGGQLATGIMKIYKVISGITTLLNTYTEAISLNDVFKFEINGTTLKIYRNGAEKVSATDATFSTGKVGIGLYGGVSTDNFEAGTLAPSAPTNLTLACGV